MVAASLLVLPTLAHDKMQIDVASAVLGLGHAVSSMASQMLAVDEPPDTSGSAASQRSMRPPLQADLQSNNASPDAAR